LMIGQRRDAAFGMFCSTLISLSVLNPTSRVKFYVLDGSTPDLGYHEQFKKLTTVLSHEVNLIDYREVSNVVEEINLEVESRLEGEKGPEIIILVFDLQRYRQLRQEDDYSFSMDQEIKKTPSQYFANILCEGPSVGVHTIVWCDSLNNLNRTFNRKSLREFEMQVLFQMSAGDSSELIDLPAASKLGLHKALLYFEKDGLLERFRPYSKPDGEFMEMLEKSRIDGNISYPE